MNKKKKKKTRSRRDEKEEGKKWSDGKSPSFYNIILNDVSDIWRGNRLKAFSGGMPRRFVIRQTCHQNLIKMILGGQVDVSNTDA